jgi:uncharacterized membrane protein (DUF485 family)
LLSEEGIVTTGELNIQAVLSVIRRRRWYVWLVMIVYFPSTWLTLEMTQSYRATGIVFAVWFVFLCLSMTLFAVIRCPQCGNYFHMRNATLSFARTCRHCGQSLKADKIS